MTSHAREARGASDAPGSGRVALLLGVFLLPGMVLVAVLWHAMNRLVAGDLGQLLIALPLAALLVAFLVVFARQLMRLEANR